VIDVTTLFSFVKLVQILTLASMRDDSAGATHEASKCDRTQPDRIPINIRPDIAKTIKFSLFLSQFLRSFRIALAENVIAIVLTQRC
jgi:hypothetical protein